MAGLLGAFRSRLGSNLLLTGAAGAAALTAVQSGWLSVGVSVSSYLQDQVKPILFWLQSSFAVAKK